MEEVLFGVSWCVLLIYLRDILVNLVISLETWLNLLNIVLILDILSEILVHRIRLN